MKKMKYLKKWQRILAESRGRMRAAELAALKKIEVRRLSKAKT